MIQCKATIDIHYVPERAKDYKYFLVRGVENKLYYYGAENDYNRAVELIKEHSRDNFLLLIENPLLKNSWFLYNNIL